MDGPAGTVDADLTEERCELVDPDVRRPLPLRLPRDDATLRLPLERKGALSDGAMLNVALVTLGK